MRNRNFQIYEDYAEKIDRDVSLIQEKIVQFGNQPLHLNPKRVSKIFTEILELLEWIE